MRFAKARYTMKRRYTRRDLGSHALKLGLAGSMMSTLSSRAEAAGTGYESDPAGVPQPATTAQLREAFADAPEHSMIESPPGTTYQIDSSLVMPPFVEWDGRGSTVVNNGGGDAIRLDNRSRVFNVDVEMGNADGGAFVYDSSLSRQTLDTTTVGGTVTGSPGSGARGVFVKADDDRVFGHNFTVRTIDIDYPVDMWSPKRGGFVTSMYGDVKATNFDIGIRCRGDGETTVNSSLLHVDMNPGDGATTLLEVDHPDAAQNVAFGTGGDASAYDQLVHVKETRHPPLSARAKAMHDFLSRDGYSSTRSPGLVRNDTNYDFRSEETPEVIDCSQ